ncbi:MAG: lamin tail domain-containing protein [Deltaproteobacteria bacterium]|nr:lamin tail domain-containing protein [Deltaproteobacteria bacterium]
MLYDPADDATGEYVELYNKGGSPVGLGGWTLNAAKGSWLKQLTFADTDEIPAGGYLVVHDGGVTVSAGSAAAVANLDLGNAGSSGDAVRLDDCEGRIIDTVIYGANNTDSFLDDSGAVATSYAPKASEGQAIRRDALGADTDQSGVDFTVGDPTPGAATPSGGGDPDECVLLGGVVINELLPNSAGSDNADWLELYNPGTSEVTLTGWTLEYGTSTYSSAKSLSDVVIPAGGLVLIHDDGFTPPSGATGYNLSIDLGTGSNSDAVRVVNCLGEPVDTVVYSDPNENSWVDDSGAVATSFAPKPNSEESIGRRIDGHDTDQSGEDFTLYLVSEVTPGQPNPVPFDCAADGELEGLVINEIMTTPDTALAPGEWIELLNVSGGELTLTGWTLNTGKSSYDKTYALDTLTVPADGYVLVHDPDYTTDVSTLAPEALTMVVELDLGNATSNADAVQILNCDGEPVDTLVYGKENTDGFLDDVGDIAESIAPLSGSGESIGRRVNGVDSDLSFEDFTVFELSELSPGFENPEPPPCDVSGNGLVLINEVLTDAAGADAGQHWIELVNLGAADIDLGGWELQVAPSTWPDFGEGLSLPGGTILPAGGFLVIYEADTVFTNLPEGAPTFVVAAGELDLGNGSSEDGLRLMDCGGDEADALAYGPTGTAGVELDCGNAAFPTLAPAPGESQTLGRSADAADTDQCTDFTLLPTMSPGAENANNDCVPTDDAPKSGCRGRGSSTADPCGGTTAYEPPGRCATAPFGGLEAVVLALALLRRRRP